MENNFIQALKKGVHVAIGATVSCVETLQDPFKRSEAINTLQTQLNQKTQEWAAKGKVTETEAQTFIDNLMDRGRWQGNYNSSSNSSGSTKSTSSGNSRLQELTEEIIALKLELEKLRKSKDN